MVPDFISGRPNYVAKGADAELRAHRGEGDLEAQTKPRRLIAVGALCSFGLWFGAARLRAVLGICAMHPKMFSDNAGLHAYAQDHGLDYVWEGTAAFERHERQ